MKIYHTETQEDFDALMFELEAKGIEWANGTEITAGLEEWKTYGSRTCVRVDDTDAFYREKAYYTSAYPNIPITKYKAKADEKMKFTKENIEGLVNKYFDDNVGECPGNLIAEIYAMDDTPEKVVVPKYIAEWIQSYLNEGGTPIDVLGSLMSFHASFVDESVIRWFKKNSETMLKALTNGYTIEKEVLYYIPLPDLETSDGIQQVLSKRKNDTNYFASRPASALKQSTQKKNLSKCQRFINRMRNRLRRKKDELRNYAW